MTPTNTLIHLDGIALGSLVALAVYTLRLSRRAWLWIGVAAFVLGIAAAATVAGGTAFLDSALAVGFAGAMLAAIASTGAAEPAQCGAAPGAAGILWTHQLRPLHDAHFCLHLFRMVRRTHECLRHGRESGGCAFRLVATTVVASALWYGFESQILKLKRFFLGWRLPLCDSIPLMQTGRPPAFETGAA